MATLHKKSGAAYAGISFGIPSHEGSAGTLVTQKVSISKKVKKKDLRGREGGFKSIVSFGETIEYSIDGAVVSGASVGFALAALYDPANDPFSTSVNLYVESITINEKNDDFKKVSVKLVGSVFLSAV
jgi:hypothetical protein